MSYGLAATNGKKREQREGGASTSTIEGLKETDALPDGLLSRSGKQLGVFLFKFVKEQLSDRVKC